jgi:opacity protein-like surface antigen
MLLMVLSGLFLYDIGNAQNFEVFAIVQQMKGDKTKFDDQELKVADNTLVGFGAGLSGENINLNMAFLFGSTELTSESIKLESKLFDVEANLDYVFFSGGISPLISAGIGSITFTDSFTGYENLNETNFSYNIAAGLRAVLSDQILIKGLYKTTWTKIQDSDSAIQLNGISVLLGYIF